MTITGSSTIAPVLYGQRDTIMHRTTALKWAIEYLTNSMSGEHNVRDVIRIAKKFEEYLLGETK